MSRIHIDCEVKKNSSGKKVKAKQESNVYHVAFRWSVKEDNKVGQTTSHRIMLLVVLSGQTC